MMNLLGEPVVPWGRDKPVPDMRFVEGCYFQSTPTGPCISKVPEACECDKMYRAGLRWWWVAGVRCSQYVWEMKKP